MIETRVQGSVESGFEPVREAFVRNFERFGEVGAACCVYRHGKPVVDLAGGFTMPDGTAPYTTETLQMVWSATKGVVAIAAHMLAQEGELDFDAPVVEYWPEFAARGKEKIPVRWLFSHRSGLAALDRPVTLADMLAWTPVIDALAAQEPFWEPGTAHGYHTVTYGWLAGEVLRRIAGKSVGRLVAERIAAPLGAEFWIGLPESENARVAPVLAPAAGDQPNPYTERFADPTSLTHKSFATLGVGPSDLNGYPFRSAELPAGNGIGTARALARIYAACISDVDGMRLLSPETVANAMAVQSDGPDLVMVFDTRFGTGFQLSYPFRPMAGEGSFGHYGSGGSVGFAHPDLGISFGYVMNQMRPVWGADPRTKSLTDALMGCL